MAARKRRGRVEVPRPVGRRRAVELVKDGLILLFTVSALYLAARSQLYAGLTGGIWDAVTSALGMDDAQAAPAILPARPVIQPVSIALCTGVDLGDGVRERCGIQYDASAVGAAFDEVRRFLGEALAGAGPPQTVSRKEWQSALQAPGIYLDLLGAAPLPALVRWLGDGGIGNGALEGQVRKLVLADRGAEGAVLYYINEETGLYYASHTSVPVTGELTAALSSHAANGARFAFEAGAAYAALDPDVLLPAETPAPAVYRASTPDFLDDQDLLNELQRKLSFRPAGYPTADGWGNDTLHVNRDGTVVYDGRVQEDERYGVPSLDGGADLAGAVSTARGLAEVLLSLGQNKSEARLTLLGVEEAREGVWSIRFGYTLGGAAVELEGSATAAQFWVKEDRIITYRLNFRYYEDTGERSGPLLPEAQAAAALSAMGRSGSELALCYTDDGSDSAFVRADWVARK